MSKKIKEYKNIGGICDSNFRTMYSEKYIPTTIDQLDYGNKKILYNCTTPPNSFRSLIIHGRKGVGKRTRAYTVLNNLYGNQVNELKSSKVPLNGNKRVIVQFKYSFYHMEINPILYNNKEFQVLSQLIDIKKQNYFVDDTRCKYYTYLIHNVDKLSIQSQKFIIQAIERGTNIRFILTTNSYSRLPSKMHSTTIKIKVGGPTKNDLKNIFTKIGNAEGFKVSKLAVDRIISKMINPDSIKEALYLFQLSYRGGKFMEYKQLWQENFDCIILLICKFNPKLVNEKFWSDLRELLIKTLLSSFSGTDAIKYILRVFVNDKKYLDNWLDICNYASLYESRMDGSGKDLVHLETFIIRLSFLLSQ